MAKFKWGEQSERGKTPSVAIMPLINLLPLIWFEKYYRQRQRLKTPSLAIINLLPRIWLVVFPFQCLAKILPKNMLHEQRRNIGAEESVTSSVSRCLLSHNGNSAACQVGQYGPIQCEPTMSYTAAA